MLLVRPPPEWRRPTLTWKLKAEVLLLRWQAGLAPPAVSLSDIRFDHRPPLYARHFDTLTQDTSPPANDTFFIEPVDAKVHDVRTHGRGGEKRISTYGSDTHERTKSRALTKQQAEVRKRLLKKKPGKARVKSNLWPKRKFPPTKR